MTITHTIQKDISENPVILYMKGTKDQPACGFSATVVHILKTMNVEFADRNVLADDALRQGIKDFANWPTIPQLYVRGEFIGGCDIVREMYESGELKELLAG